MSSSDAPKLRGACRLCRLAGVTLLAGAANLLAEERPGLWVSVEDDIVSVEARDIPIRHILEEIARHTDLEVVTHDPLSEHVSVDLQDSSMFQAMRRILKDRSYTLSYVPAEDGRIASLRILSTDPGSIATSSSRLEFVSSAPPVVSPLAEDGEDLAMLAADALSHRDPFVRVEAVYALGEIGPSNARILEQALMDPSAEVRESAIEALADIGGSESASALEVALNDVEVSVRLEAVEALGEIGGQTAADLLRKALADEATREAAAELLAEFPEHP